MHVFRINYKSRFLSLLLALIICVLFFTAHTASIQRTNASPICSEDSTSCPCDTESTGQVCCHNCCCWIPEGSTHEQCRPCCCECACQEGDTEACGTGGVKTCDGDCNWSGCKHQKACTIGQIRGCTTGTATCSGGNCPGWQECINPPGDAWDANWGTCHKYDDNCPCGNRLVGRPDPSKPGYPGNTYSEACDVGASSCVDYDEDGCSAGCSDTSQVSCSYRLRDSGYRTSGGQEVFQSGQTQVSDLVTANPSVRKYKAGTGHNGLLDDPIYTSIFSTWRNHIAAPGSVHAETKAHDGYCTFESKLVDYFPQVGGVRVFNYREINDAGVGSPLDIFGMGDAEYGDIPWSGKHEDDKDQTDDGTHVPREIIIPYGRDEDNIDTCDPQNPVVFLFSVSDNDSSRELDQVNFILSSQGGAQRGGCDSFETGSRDNYVGITFSRRNGAVLGGGPWVMGSLCGGALNPNIEIMPIRGRQFLSRESGTTVWFAFAVKFKEGFNEGSHNIYLKARSSYYESINNRILTVHRMYSGYSRNPNGGDMYLLRGRWGVDMTPPTEGNLGYEKVTAEVVDVTWYAHDGMSGVRSMNNGCYKSASDGNKVMGYPFDDPDDDIPTETEKNAEQAKDLEAILESCQISAKTTESASGEIEKVNGAYTPYIDNPVEEIGEITHYDAGWNPVPFPTDTADPDWQSRWGLGDVVYQSPYRKFTKMDFTPIYKKEGIDGAKNFSITRRYGKLEELQTYKFREIVSDKVCNVGVHDLSVTVGGKWMHTVGGEVYAENGFNTRINGDSLPYYLGHNGNNPRVPMSTFCVSTGPGTHIPPDNKFPQMGWYSDPRYAKCNIEDYKMLESDDEDTSLLQSEVFAEDTGVFYQLWAAATYKEQQTGVSRTFHIDSSVPAGSAPCNTEGITGCGGNEWERDLSAFIQNVGGGIIKIRVNGTGVIFEGRRMHYNKDVILLFDGASEVKFWHQYVPELNGKVASTIVLVNGGVELGSTGHDWDYEIDMKGAMGEAFNEKWHTEGAIAYPSDISGIATGDNHIYYGGADDIIDPGVDMFKMYIMAKSYLHTEKEGAVASDPSMYPVPLSLYDVTDVNFERLELFGGAAVGRLDLQRNLIALDNNYIPAEKIVFDPSVIDVYNKIIKDYTIESKYNAGWEETGFSY